MGLKRLTVSASAAVLALSGIGSILVMQHQPRTVEAIELQPASPAQDSARPTLEVHTDPAPTVVGDDAAGDDVPAGDDTPTGDDAPAGDDTPAGNDGTGDDAPAQDRPGGGGPADDDGDGGGGEPADNDGDGGDDDAGGDDSD